MTDGPLGRMVVTRKTGSEPLNDGGAPLGPSLLDFWRWSVSDLVSNATRGRLAEFIVASAVGIDVGSAIRDEWQAFDLRTQTGVKIEVKSAAYLQTWFQKRESRILFGVERRRGWDADTGEQQREAGRHADVYVFALLAHRGDKTKLDPLDVGQWRFWAVSAANLDGYKRSQHCITLKSLVHLAGEGVRYPDLRGLVECAAGDASSPRT